MPSTRIVFHTIASVFPNCRLFRESAKQQDANTDNPADSASSETTADSGTDFINSVLFCRNTNNTDEEPSSSSASSHAKQQIRFRTPTERDYLGSIARRNYLMPNEELEVDFPLPVPLVDGKEPVALLRKGRTAPLEKFQLKSALSHWRIMRTVLPPGVWENW